MTFIATVLIISAALGAPPLTQDTDRAAGGPAAAGALEAAQQPRTAPPPPPPAPPPPDDRQSPEERERTLPPPPPPAPPAPAARRGYPTRNIKVDVTISDQTGSGTPMKKVVSMIVADGRSSGVRSMTSVPLATGGPNRDLPLNVDAFASITHEGKVLLELKFNYASVTFVTPVGTRERPAPTTDAERDLSAPRPSTANITEELRVLLTSGAPVVVARSADAAADRTVTVEVRAEVLK